MTTRNLLAALIGVLFMSGPWWMHFDRLESAVMSSLIAGFIQLASSLLALGKTGWNAWPNWLSLLCGVWFIMFPMSYMLGTWETVFYLTFGVVTVLLNYFNMNHEPFS
ncbi:hypothetical protein O9H85_07405 [Paenibacillus filicis]|uniref:SPW repeat-containing integral membrane domain-containing protein n=1 Tax=Paenibacillus gyeongsangnamensis TaxID=3388067 RepID=A0ABT4Q5V3_9BACL|nr:hypothetical protein [Paenibacillus filicis]MCZ8512255.1 hypothetical protein [Paenibacillus filicis]